MRKKAGPVIAALLLIVVIGLILIVGKKIEDYIPSEEVQDLDEYYGIERPDDVKIRIRCCGICGSEIHSEQG